MDNINTYYYIININIYYSWSQFNSRKKYWAVPAQQIAINFHFITVSQLQGGSEACLLLSRIFLTITAIVCFFLTVIVCFVLAFKMK